MPPTQDSPELQHYRRERIQELREELKKNHSEEQKINIRFAIGLYKEKKLPEDGKKIGFTYIQNGKILENLQQMDPESEIWSEVSITEITIFFLLLSESN